MSDHTLGQFNTMWVIKKLAKSHKNTSSNNIYQMFTDEFSMISATKLMVQFKMS